MKLKIFILVATVVSSIILSAYTTHKWQTEKVNNKYGADDTVKIFNGKDLSNLHIVLADKELNTDKMYEIKDGTIYFEGGYKGYLRTNKSYPLFKLHAEWMWTKPKEKGNSGILVYIQKPDTVWPNCIQINYKENSAGDLIAMNGATFKEAEGKPKGNVEKLGASSEKPEGQWNSCDIICQGDSLTVYINNKLQNKATKIGVTNGTLGWQLEGKPIAMRNIYLVKIK